MASRLSGETLEEAQGKSLIQVLDAGQQGMVIQTEREFASLAPLKIDLDALLVSEDPAAAVQALPPQVLFNALLEKGPEDCLDVLELMAPDQVVRILDYDAWRHDELEPRRMVRWLNLFKEVSDEELYKRFRELDEEYQLALLNPLIDLIEEDEFEKLSDVQQDELYRLPCGTLYYRIKSGDPLLIDFVTNLVEATLQQDVSYVYAFLAHAAYLPPHEAEAMIGQFRKARLTEDGFVTFEESMQAFRPLDLAELTQRLDFQTGSESLARESLSPQDGALFLQRALAAMPTDSAGEEARRGFQHGLLFLSNSLCAAAQIEPDDLTGLRLLLAQAQSLVSLGLEYLAAGDERRGAVLLPLEHPQIFFRVGLTLVHRLAEGILGQLERHQLPQAAALKRQLLLDKRGSLLAGFDQVLLPLLGFERTEALKGLCNRLPLQAVEFRPDERGAQRMIFTPIGSRAALNKLAATIDTQSGLLAVAALADQDKAIASVPLERRLLTALARVLSGGEFRSEALEPKELQSLIALSNEAAQTLASDVFASIEGSLRLALAPGAAAAWVVSRGAGMIIPDPVQGVMEELASLSLRLGAARAYAQDLALPAQREALAGLIELVPEEAL